MLINHQEIKTNQTREAQFPTPVVGSINDNIPTSADVHLYSDPDTIWTDLPVLYADCEGLEGGVSAPKAEGHKLQEKARFPTPEFGKSTGTNARKRLQRKGFNAAARKIRWAQNDKEKSQREYAVTELYPRLLYTFSDVVVFVLRNVK